MPLHKNWIALLQAAKGVALDLERLLSHGNAIQDLIPSEYHRRNTPWEDVVSRWPDGSDDCPFGTARHPDAVLACRSTVRRTDHRSVRCFHLPQTITGGAPHDLAGNEVGLTQEGGGKGRTRAQIQFFGSSFFDEYSP